MMHSPQISQYPPVIHQSPPQNLQPKKVSVFPPLHPTQRHLPSPPSFGCVLLTRKAVLPAGAAARAASSRDDEGGEAAALARDEKRVLQPAHTTGNTQTAREQDAHVRPWAAE